MGHKGFESLLKASSILKASNIFAAGSSLRDPAKVKRYGARGAISTAKDVAAATKADLMKVARYSKMAGRVLGVGSVFATAADVASDGVVTIGEGAKVLISGIAASNPVAGLAIFGLDLASEAITGKSGSQWIADGIDKFTEGLGLPKPW